VASLELLLAEPGVGEVLDEELELGIEELELLLDEGDVEELVSEPVPLMEALPLTEPDAPGVVELLLAELGGVVVSVELVDVELDGMLLVVAGVVAEVLLLLVPLLRSQPVTAAVATASTATRGMSLFMTSPFEFEMSDDPSRGPGLPRFNEDRHARHVPARSHRGDASGRPSSAPYLSRAAGKTFAAAGQSFRWGWRS